MKKLLVGAFALISIAASAQKGSVLVGGDLQIGATKSPNTPNDSKFSGIGIRPLVGYQFDENWTAGVKANIRSTKATNNLNNETKESTLGVGPFVRYTKTLSDIFSLYGQLQGEFGSSKTNGTKINTYTSLDIFPAVFVHVKKGFGLNFSFGGLGYTTIKPTGGKATNEFTLNFGQSATIGVTKNFSSKKSK